MNERGLILLSEKKWQITARLVGSLGFIALLYWNLLNFNGDSSIVSLFFAGSSVAIILHILSVSLCIVALAYGFKEDLENWLFNKRFYTR